jgi:hypothetical protein
LDKLKRVLEKSGAVFVTGGDFDPWDFAIHGGLFGSIRVVAMVEEHGAGRQLCRFRSWPRCPLVAGLSLLAFVSLALWAGLDHAFLASGSLLLTAAGLLFLICADCAIATTSWRDAIERYVRGDEGLKLL